MQGREVMKLHLNGCKVNITFKEVGLCHIHFFVVYSVSEIYILLTLLFPTQNVEAKGLKYFCLFREQGERKILLWLNNSPTLV